MKNSDTANKTYNAQLDFAKKAHNLENILPRRYVFILTNLCNLRCSFCFQERKRKKNAMNKNDWLSLIDQLPENSRITLTGGEPLVFKGFEEVFLACCEKAQEVNIVSNGLLLNDEIIKLLLSKKNFSILGISIDTIGNYSRDFKNNQWNVLTNQIKNFVKERNKINHKSAVDIKSVILDDNIDELFNLHKYCMEELNADTHSFQLLKGAEIQHSDVMFLFEDIDKEYKAYEYKNFNKLIYELDRIREYNYKNNFKSYLHPNLIELNGPNKLKYSDYLYLNSRSHDASKFDKCYSPWSSVHINVDGNLFPCMAVPMGNLKENSLRNIIFSNQFKKFKEIIKNCGTIKGCNRCGWLRSKNS
jgi:MoaA/NifB/PqqE/SkfB family radical SAM enzyme